MLQATRTAGSRLFSAFDQDLLTAAAAVIGSRLAALPPLRGAEEARPGQARLAVQALSPSISLDGQTPVDAVTVAHAEEAVLGDQKAVAPAECGLDYALPAQGGVPEDIKDNKEEAEVGSASCNGDSEAGSFTVCGAGRGLDNQMETVTRLEPVPEEEEDEELGDFEVQQGAEESCKFEIVDAGSGSVTVIAIAEQGSGVKQDGETAPAPVGQVGDAWGWAEEAGLQVDEMFTVARQAEGLFHYAPQEPDELAVRPGQRLSLLGLAQPGWYLADAGESRTDASASGRGRRVGLVPSNFIRLR
jgi:hypothetical protein